MLSNKEIQILRDLANEYMQFATLPHQQEKVGLWKALNSSKMQRPMVAIDQLPWNELNYDGSLICQITDEYFRDIENNLRQSIYKYKNFEVDMVLQPFIEIPKVIYNTGYDICEAGEKLATDSENSIVSHHIKNQIQTEEDIEKIKDMVITYDEKATIERFSEAKQIFDGIAPVILGGGVSLHLGIWDHLSFLMGIEDVYYDLIDRPEFIHKILDRITSATLAGIKQINELKVCNTQANICHCSYIYTDELLPNWGSNDTGVTQKTWAFAMAQLFGSSSPQVTEEFEVPYINKLAQYYGMMYYGCCERLDDRLEIVKKIKNVKKISCSPWSNSENFAEQIGDKIIMSVKPNPAFLATKTFDEEVIKKDLTNIYNIAKKNNVNVEFILKDLSTVNYDYKRLTKWADIAMKVVCK